MWRSYQNFLAQILQITNFMLSVSNELLKLTIKYFLLLSFSFVALCCFVVIVGFSAIDVFKSIRLVRLRYETLVFFFL